MLEFLRKENRPFSAQDVATSLGGQLGKSAVVKILDELAAEKKINEKIYNKSKVFMTLQVNIINNKKKQNFFCCENSKKIKKAKKEIFTLKIWLFG